MKLAGEGVPYVRLGREQTVHPAVRPHLPGGERHPAKTAAALKELAQSIPVVSMLALSPFLPWAADAPAFGGLGSGCSALGTLAPLYE
jgi:hypothetical protein